MQGINRVQEILDNESAAYFVSGYNLRYMSGMPCSDAGTLIVTKNRAYLIIDFRYIEVAKTACFPGVEVILQGKTYEQVKKILDKEGIAVRAGHHCAQPALRALGYEMSVRPTFALYNTREDVDKLVIAVKKIIGR